MRFGRGESVRRFEDQRLVTGTGTYSDDFNLDGQAYVAFARSPYAHARLRSVDAASARTMPGVLAVYTGADLVAAGVKSLPIIPIFKRPDGEPAGSPPRHVIAVDEVRFAGEIVAAVVAETMDAAQDAAEAIEIDYETLPVVADIAAALAPGAPVVFDGAPGNVVAEMRYGDAAAVEAAFGSAAHVAKVEVTNARLVGNALEPRAAVAEFDAASGKYTIHVSNQTPTGVKDTLAGFILNVPPEKVRVRVRDIGGGFGVKAGMNHEDAVVAFAAGQLKRPVKWRSSRGEDFLSMHQGRDLVSTVELALDGDGRIKAMRMDFVGNMGAYMNGVGALIPLILGPKIVSGVYDIPLIDVRGRVVTTNSVFTSAYRGAGRPEAIYRMERAMDKAAEVVGIDRAEIRLRNMIKPEQMPYTNPTGQKFDSGDFPHFLKESLRLADWDGFQARRDASRAKGKLRGRGISSYIEWTGGEVLTENVRLVANADGTVTLYSATQAMGQGLDTSYRQIVAEKLGIDPTRIKVIQGDTDVVAGMGSVGSRSLFVGGSATLEGTEAFVKRAGELAADALEASQGDIAFADGAFTVAGTDRSIALGDLAGRQPDRLIAIDHQATVGGPSWPNGCHVCEVEIDPDTGEAIIDRYFTVDDVGNAVNPMIVLGQIQGGIAQGLGEALQERVVLDESGQPLTGSFMDYTMPRAEDFPTLVVKLDDIAPCQTNPLGSKGCGESGTVGAPPAIMGAIEDALKQVGVKRIDMPATPHRVWQAIHAATGTRAAA